jgi:hypothetical protein
MLTRLITAVVCTITTCLTATIPPDVKKVVAFVFPADAEGKLLRDPKTKNPVPWGTGFFVAVKSGAGGQGVYGYFVTAKHVLKDEKHRDFSRVYLRLNKLQGDAEFVPLDLMRAGRSVVNIHCDPTVDIAVVPAYPNETLFDFRVLPDDFLTTKASFREWNISEGADVFFTGLFVPHYGEHRNFPIARFGRVAMIPEERIVWRDDPSQPPQRVELYLLETQSYGGNSGSPVFFYLGADRSPGSLVLGEPVLKLAGVMRGNFNEPRPIGLVMTERATIPVPYSTQNVGIAAVTPSYLLHEILFSTELKKQRADSPIK